MPEGYAVLTFDARPRGGQFTLDGPRELDPLRELLTWAHHVHPVDAQHVGAYAASYARMLRVAGLAAIAPVQTLYRLA